MIDAPINTIEVAITTKQLLAKWGVERLTIVTSDFMLARAQTLFQTLLSGWALTFHPW